MEYVIQGWPDGKNQLPQDIRFYKSFRDDMAVIDGLVIKGKHRVILLQQQVLKQLHIQPHEAQKTKLLACEFVYWIGMNADIENHMQNCSTCLDFQQTQPNRKLFHNDIPGKPWEMIGVNMFSLNNKKLPLNCRLLQQIFNSKKGKKHVCGQLNISIQSDFCRIWITKKK